MCGGHEEKKKIEMILESEIGLRILDTFTKQVGLGSSQRIELNTHDLIRHKLDP